PQTLRYALALAKQDLDRRLLLTGRKSGVFSYLGAVLHPGGLAVLLFRLIDYTHSHSWRGLTRLGHLASYYLASIEIHPGARIGPGLVLPDTGGVGIPKFCEIGRNCTILGPALLTVGGMEGIDLDKDLIILGEHCVIGSNVRIIGAVTLGNGTQIKPGSVVIISCPKEGCLLSGIPARRRSVVPLSDIQHWNPLTGCSLDEKNISGEKKS
ncbi:MAG: hypothetical protein R8K20_04825, partial [Gallionellaceae bacterium]